MLAARIAFAFASLGALPAAAGSQPAAPAPADRILVDHADGSWTITRAIGEEPMALEIAARGLIAGGKDAPNRLRQGGADEAAERAFEEAIEQARRERRRQ